MACYLVEMKRIDLPGQERFLLQRTLIAIQQVGIKWISFFIDA